MKKIIASLFIISFVFLTPTFSSAQLLEGGALDGLENNAQEVRASSGFSDSVGLGTVVATIIQAILGLLAAIFLVLMVLAGFQWMTAAGNEAQITKAQDIMKAALIGLVIILAAYAITYFVFTQLPFGGGLQVGSSGTGGAIVSGGE